VLWHAAGPPWSSGTHRAANASNSTRPQGRPGPRSARHTQTRAPTRLNTSKPRPARIRPIATSRAETPRTTRHPGADESTDQLEHPASAHADLRARRAPAQRDIAGTGRPARSWRCLPPLVHGTHTARGGDTATLTRPPSLGSAFHVYDARVTISTHRRLMAAWSASIDPVGLGSNPV